MEKSMDEIDNRKELMNQYTTKTDEMFARIGATYEKGIDIIAAKNADYADSDANGFLNFEESAILAGGTPEQGFLFRIADKLIRVKNLLRKGEAAVKNETIEDTLLDAINYLALLKTYLEMKAPQKEEKKLTTIDLQNALDNYKVPDNIPPAEQKADPTFFQKIVQALKS
jgi:hypothetical protein